MDDVDPRWAVISDCFGTTCIWGPDLRLVQRLTPGMASSRDRVKVCFGHSDSWTLFFEHPEDGDAAVSTLLAAKVAAPPEPIRGRWGAP